MLRHSGRLVWPDGRAGDVLGLGSGGGRYPPPLRTARPPLTWRGCGTDTNEDFALVVPPPPPLESREQESRHSMTLSCHPRRNRRRSTIERVRRHEVPRILFFNSKPQRAPNAPNVASRDLHGHAPTAGLEAGLANSAATTRWSAFWPSSPAQSRAGPIGCPTCICMILRESGQRGYHLETPYPI